MTKLSVNINKIAVVRNSRGGNLPDVVRAALDIERFGAEGITVHPRPDARHIRYDDVRDLKRALTTELNIEGNPIPIKAAMNLMGMEAGSLRLPLYDISHKNLETLRQAMGRMGLL